MYFFTHQQHTAGQATEPTALSTIWEPMPASGCRPGSRLTRRIWNRAPRVCTAHAPCQGHSDGGFVPGTAERWGTQRTGAEEFQ
ncbi:hypothetical protein IPC1499_30930 [Pseudomonas aeruginosa]|nr:hypothetical protein IPC1499_30930 [Pseudomonas aeruginosa]